MTQTNAADLESSGKMEIKQMYNMSEYGHCHEAK